MLFVTCHRKIITTNYTKPVPTDYTANRLFFKGAATKSKNQNTEVAGSFQRIPPDAFCDLSPKNHDHELHEACTDGLHSESPVL